MTETETERHLYVPSEGISREAQINHGYKLIKHCSTVWVHDHPYGVTCPMDDRCVRIVLRDGSEEPILEAAGQREDAS